MKLFKIVTMVTICLATTAQAVDYANEVLAIGVGARALGMGGAFVGIADDSTAVYWNPAGLPQVPHVEVSVIQEGREYDSLGLNEVGSSYIFLSGAMNAGPLGSFGAAFMRFGVQDIPQISGLDAAGVPIQVGTFQTQDLGFMGSWGKQWFKSFSTGITLKYLTGGTDGLQDGLNDASYSYVGADLGFLVNFGAFTSNLDGLSLGLNLQDIVNSGVMWKNTPTNPTDEVDSNPKVGLAYSPPLQFLKYSDSKLNFAVDVDPKYQINTLIHYGAEFWYRDTVAFRAGLREFLGGLQDNEWSLGASFKLYILQIDYSYIDYELTPIQYLSLAVKF
jgi:hypothetical protein